MAQVKSFALYARSVSKEIDDPKARKEVYQEIYNHLLESKEALMAAGISEKEAEDTAIRQMGDADHVGSALTAFIRLS